MLNRINKPLLIDLFALGLSFPAILLPRPLLTPLLLALPLAWFLHWRGSESFVPRTPLSLPLLLMALMLLVSLWATFSIEFSLAKVSGLVFGIGVFFAVVRHGERRCAWTLAGFLITGVAVAILGLFGTTWPAKVPGLGALVERIPLLVQGLPAAETGIHPNELGGILAMFLPLGLVMLLGRRASASRRTWPGRIALGLAVLVLAFVLFLTQSRSAYIGLSFGLALLFAGAGRRGRIALAVLAVAAMIVVSQVGIPTLLGLDQAEAVSPVGEITFASRFEIWSRALYGLQDFVFTGMGMGTFRRVAPVLYPFFMISPEKDVAHAHNLFLQTGLDLGVPGLIAYLALWLSAFAMLFKVYNRDAQEPLAFGLTPRALALGLAGGLLAHFIYGLTDAVTLGAKPGFLWWWLLGLIASLYGISKLDSEKADSNQLSAIS